MANTKSPIEKRHERTSRQFSQWLSNHPDATRDRKIHAFNVIADVDYKQARKARSVKKSSRKTVKNK